MRRYRYMFTHECNSMYTNLDAFSSSTTLALDSHLIMLVTIHQKKATDSPFAIAHSMHACWCLQNLVDSLAQHFQEAVPSERHSELNTFVVYNQRSRVTSSAKRKRPPGSLKIHQTPDGSFLDLQRNARDMLLRCSFQVPQVLFMCPFATPAVPALLNA